MEITKALILGLLQGITEFLPISSSGHLILAEKILGLDVSELKSFDVALHIGSLLAILVYFWNDIFKMISAFFKWITGKVSFNDPHLKLIFLIIIGTIPAVIIGFIFGNTIDQIFRDYRIVAINLGIVGLIFILAEIIYRKRKISKEITWFKAIIIGFCQAIALIPGISRSGATITGGLFSGIDRASVAKFSFLLGIPAILGAGILTFTEVSKAEVFNVGFVSLSVGFLGAFISGLVSVHFLMRFLKKHSLNIFAIYRIILSLVVLIFPS